MRYYFVLPSLPSLSFQTRPELSFGELKDFLLLNLAPKDIEKFSFLLRPIDLYNTRALWLGMPLDDRGNFVAKDLEEALLNRDPFLPGLVDYLDRYETTTDRLRYFSSLFASLFREAELILDGFLRRYFQFEREVLLVLTALRAKQTGRQIVQEMQFEDSSDPLIAYILAQKDTPDFVPPQEFEILKALFVKYNHSPEVLNRAILQYRFEMIEEMEQEAPFSIDQILGYVARFLMVDGCFRLDHEQGNLAVEVLSGYE